MSKTAKLREDQVGLFNKYFRNDAHLKTLKPVLDAHNAWNIDLKSRRDPSAHRMPLYVPTALLSETEAARHEAIWHERAEAIRNGQYDRDNELADEQSKLGTFRGVFLHDPDKDGYRIYQTVPTDVGRLITIGKAIHAELPAFSAGEK